MCTFRVLEAKGTGREEWLHLFSGWRNWEVFAHPEYLKLFLEPGQRALCAVYIAPAGRVFYPFILRDLRRTDFWNGTAAFDTVGPPFGYGGPFVETGGDPMPLAKTFFDRYKEWLCEKNVISEYVTFSPKDTHPWPYPGQVIERAPTVIRDLDMDEDGIWMDYKPSLRNKIRKANRQNICVEMDSSGKDLCGFLHLYDATMRRRQASAGYHLDVAFLERLNRTLAGYCAYFHARKDQAIISTELVLISKDSAFFFRGGTAADKLKTGANVLLKHWIIQWAREQGKRFYLLGGGNSPEDSLFKYKRAFAPKGVRPLRVGKWLVDKRRYDELFEARRAHEAARGRVWSPRQGFFPAYRAPSET